MKKLGLIVIGIMLYTCSFAQEDSVLIIPSKTKVIQIGNRQYYTATLQSETPIFMPGLYQWEILEGVLRNCTQNIVPFEDLSPLINSLDKQIQKQQ